MQDHPRVCGEKHPGGSSIPKNSGSPPRVRGKVHNLAFDALHDGITPACAGKRRREERTCCCGWDHPRVCGEKWCSDALDGDDWGSPPRVRGKDQLIFSVLVLFGITPACAGKRFPLEWRTAYIRDHPRVCGEKWREAARCGQQQGSPPRVRGKVASIFRGGCWTRITPACAGKRGFFGAGFVGSGDHPRVCGEKLCSC